MRNILHTTGLSWLVLLFLCSAVSPLLGGSPREIQERMRERLPEIDALKQEQVVGENNKGFLESIRPLDREQKRIVEQENEDREKIYAALAERTGATTEQVGVVRARQIAERSASGVMVQDVRGDWKEKG